MPAEAFGLEGIDETEGAGVGDPAALGINLNTEPGKEVNDVEDEPEEEQGQT